MIESQGFLILIREENVHPILFHLHLFSSGLKITKWWPTLCIFCCTFNISFIIVLTSGQIYFHWLKYDWNHLSLGKHLRFKFLFLGWILLSSIWSQDPLLGGKKCHSNERYQLHKNIALYHFTALIFIIFRIFIIFHIFIIFQFYMLLLFLPFITLPDSLCDLALRCIF